jgi:aryl-alcohol dehydrogenase
MRTRAAILSQPNTPLNVTDVEVGEPKHGEVLVRMVASGVCQTDLGVIHGKLPLPLPAILGHEGAGVVEAVGPGVVKLQAGDHVVIAAVTHCACCRSCLTGKPFLCPQMSIGFLGGMMPDGTKRFRHGNEELSHFFWQSSFAEHALVPERIAVKVSKDLPLEKLAPLGCGVQTGSGAVLNTARVRPGDTVAVIGCGGVGLSAVMGARLARAMRIIAVDFFDHRLQLARELGATDVVSARATNAVAEIQKLTDGGVDFAFECIGKPETARQTVDCLRPGGTAVISGVLAPGAEIKLDGLGLLGKTVIGNVEGSSVPEEYLPKLVEFWRRGEFPFDKLTTRTYALKDINQAVADMERGDIIKPIVRY